MQAYEDRGGEHADGDRERQTRSGERPDEKRGKSLPEPACGCRLPGSLLRPQPEAAEDGHQSQRQYQGAEERKGQSECHRREDSFLDSLKRENRQKGDYDDRFGEENRPSHYFCDVGEEVPFLDRCTHCEVVTLLRRLSLGRPFDLRTAS